MRANELTALEALAKIQSGHLTSEALVEACLERIAARESIIGAWQFLDPEQARKAARNLDKSSQSGQLQGIPVAVKDIFDTADMPTTYGSPIYKNHHPPADASAIATTRAGGAVILGKTVTTEFAYFHPGKTANPHDTERTPGGSSSGSAASIADFMAPLAFGSQTVGSTIRPASYCGVVGFKPSFGLIDRTGLRPLADNFDTVGLFARDVADVAYFASVLSKRPKLRLNKDENRPPKIGLCRTSDWPAADRDTCLALETAAKLAASAGAKIKEVNLPPIFGNLGDSQAIVVNYQAANAAAFELRFRRDQVSKAYILQAQAGEAYSAEQYDEALNVLNSSQNAFNSIMEDFDALLTPSAPGEAPRGLETTGNPVFNRLGTAMRGPCINVPGLEGTSEMPVGVQLIGRVGRDQRVLSAGHWLFEILKK